LEVAQQDRTQPPAPESPREDVPHEPTESSSLTLRAVERNDIALSNSKGNGLSSDEARSESIDEKRDRTVDVAAVVWIVGGLVVAALQVRRVMRFRRWLVHAYPAPNWLTSQVAELSSLLGVRSPRLAVIPGLGSPIVWAGGRTSLLWPEGLEKELSSEGCRAVLIHELAHLARRDHWVAWLIFLTGCLWWWHPLFYLVRRSLHQEAELACDARVVAALPDSRRCFAEALLDVCQCQTRATALAPALGVLGRRRDLERRLVMIMRANVSSRLSLRMLLGIGLLGLIVLPGWSLGQVNKPGTNASEDRDKRLQELEHRLQNILKDLEAQRKPTPAVAVDWSVPVLVEAQEAPQKVLLKWLDSTPAPEANRDKKLQEIEAKLKALLKEVQALRNSKPANQGQGVAHADLDYDGIVDLVVINQKSTVPVEVTLNRTIYNLPAAKAEALGKLLQQHVKAAVMETKVEGNTLSVTTTPEVQQGIRQFIALMKGETQPTQSRQQVK
jgi:beta-lactamase regulating signal transducer with metallopeptidase domain